MPQPGELLADGVHSLPSLGPASHSPIHWGLTPTWLQKPSPSYPPDKHRLWAEGIWDLVPGRSPGGWSWTTWRCHRHWASVLLSLVTKDVLFPLGGCRDSHWILSPSQAACLASCSQWTFSALKDSGRVSARKFISEGANRWPQKWALGQGSFPLRCNPEGHMAIGQGNSAAFPSTPSCMYSNQETQIAHG